MSTLPSAVDLLSWTQTAYFPMSAKEALVAEIENQPESVLIETLHFIRFVSRQNQDERWAEVLPDRTVEQEILGLIEAP